MQRIARAFAVAVVLALVAGCGSKATPSPNPASSGATGQSTAGNPKGDTTGVTDSSIKLGSITDMTGPTANIQTPYLSGIQTYLKWVNDNGGVNGRKIELVSEDDRYTVPAAVAAFKKLTTQDKVFAILGQGGSNQVSALSDDIKDQKIPVLFPMQTTKDQLANPYFFSLLASYEDQANVLVKRAVEDMKKAGKDKPVIATVTLDVESGYEWATYVAGALGRMNLKLAKHVLVPAAATEATAQVQQLLDLKPDAIIIHGATTNNVAFLRDAARYGLKVPIYSSYGGFGDLLYQSAGKEATANFIGVHSFNPPLLDTPGLKEMREVGQRYGMDKYLNLQQYVQGWTAGRVYVEALKKAGKDLTRESLMAAIESMNDYDTQGLSAPVSFSSKNHNGVRAVRFFGYDFNKNEMVPVSDWINP